MVTLWNMVLREAAAGRAQFALGVAVATVAVAFLTAQLTVLRAEDRRTEALLSRHEAEGNARLARLAADTRESLRHLGFTLRIIPAGQRVSDLFAEDFAAETLPEAYLSRLDEARLPALAAGVAVLQKRVKWAERDMTVLCAGVGKTVSWLEDGAPPDAGMPRPAEGEVVLGYEVHRSLGIAAGEGVRLLGREFRVAQCAPEQGSRDDITVWLSLSDAQGLLGMAGRISAIRALGRHASVDMLSAIREDVARVLPGVEVLEDGARAVTRAEAWRRAGAAERQAIARERETHAALTRQRRAMAGALIMITVLGCAIAVSVLFAMNVRTRRAEIGALRALGYRTRQLFRLFFARALLVGVTGAAAGYGVGLAIGAAPASGGGFDAGILLVALLAAPALTALAGWLPAWRAAHQDPAAILQRE